MSAPTGEAGVALLTVLWFVAAMSALAIALVATGRDTAYATRNAVRAVESRIAFAGAVEIAALTLRGDRFPARGVLEWTDGPRRVRVIAEPEARKIDLNAASDELVAGLAAAVAATPEQARVVEDAILDWRDPDRERRLTGAEQGDYARTAGLARPRDGPFRFTAELRAVHGIDAALYARLAPAVTVQHGVAEPALAPFSELVQKALDRAAGLVQAPVGDAPPAVSPSGPATDALEDDDSVAGRGVFAADPNGLYTLDLELTYDDGPRFRQRTVIWIDPPLGSAAFAVLQNSTGLLPRTADGASDSGTTWRSP